MSYPSRADLERFVHFVNSSLRFVNSSLRGKYVVRLLDDGGLLVIDGKTSERFELVVRKQVETGRPLVEVLAPIIDKDFRTGAPWTKTEFVAALERANLRDHRDHCHSLETGVLSDCNCERDGS